MPEAASPEAFPFLKVTFTGNITYYILSNPIYDVRCALLPIIQKLAVFGEDDTFTIAYLAYIMNGDIDSRGVLWNQLVHYL